MKDVSRVAIIGAGVQGAQIAFRCAIYGKETAVFDIMPDMLLSAEKRIKTWLSEYVHTGKLDEAESKSSYRRISFSDSLEKCLEGAALAIEAVPEKLELKRKVWEEIDRLAAADLMLTTNSSSLKSSSIYTNVSRKSKTFNLNFMTPVKDDLVEVMWNESTC